MHSLLYKRPLGKIRIVAFSPLQKIGISNFGWQTTLEKENIEFQTVEQAPRDNFIIYPLNTW